MIFNFLAVGQNVAVLFILIGIGFLCGRTKFLSDSAVTGMTDFVLYIVTPCIMIQTFQREFDTALAGAFLQALLFATASLFAAWLLASLTLHDPELRRQSVYRFPSFFPTAALWRFRWKTRFSGQTDCFSAQRSGRSTISETGRWDCI